MYLIYCFLKVEVSEVSYFYFSEGDEELSYGNLVLNLIKVWVEVKNDYGKEVAKELVSN